MTVALSSGLTRPQDLVQQVQRVDTGAWEEAQTGVVYYSPEQHASFFDDTADVIVYRQYFSGTTGAATVVLDGSFGEYAVIACGGTVNDKAPEVNTSCPVGEYLDATMFAVVTVEAGSLNLDVGTDLDDATDTYWLWVDYVGRKITPPS
jgi:hypothetical protein